MSESNSATKQGTGCMRIEDLDGDLEKTVYQIFALRVGGHVGGLAEK